MKYKLYRKEMPKKDIVDMLLKNTIENLVDRAEEAMYLGKKDEACWLLYDADILSLFREYDDTKPKRDSVNIRFYEKYIKH